MTERQTVTDRQLKHANFNRYILSLSFCPDAVGGERESVEKRVISDASED